MVHRLLLADGQQITGQLLGIGAEEIRFHPLWTEKTLQISRSAVLAIGHPAGWFHLIADDFEETLQSWQTRRHPLLSKEQRSSGEQSLLLDSPGQCITATLPEAVAAGRLQLNFLARSAAATGLRWFLELGNADDDRPNTSLAIPPPVDGTDFWSAPNPGKPRLWFPDGWQQLAIDFSPDRFELAVNGRVVNSTSQGQNVSGPIGNIVLRCAAGSGPRLGGALWVDDLLLMRPIRGTATPPTFDPGRDMVVLRSGDEMMGTVQSADRRRIDFRSIWGPAPLSWSEARAVWFRRADRPVVPSEGEHVRIWLTGGPGSEPDQIEGPIRRLDSRQITMQHPLLGVVSIDRNWVSRLQGRLFGRRIILEARTYQLGQDLQPGLSLPRPDGLQLRRVFKLEAVPASARLVVDAAHLQGLESGPGKLGGRTEVLVNGRVVDSLNRHVERSSPAWRRLSIPLPPAVLRVAENTIELRQSRDPGSGRFGNCLVAGVVIEIPR
jgi:hypothetical protein